MEANKYEDDGTSNLVIRFTKIWEDYVDVSWSRQLFDGAKILKYQLAATALHYKVERYFTSSETTFRLVGLCPSLELTVMVRSLRDTADNGAQWSSWCKATATTLSHASLSVAAVCSSNLQGTLTWGSELTRSGPTSSHCPVTLSKYDVRVRERGRFLTSDLCEKELPPDTVNFTIEDVPTSSIFEVSARAVSVYGDLGKWSDSVRFLTLHTVDVAVKSLGENFAVVQWTRPEEDKFLPHESAIDELVLTVELLPSQRELDVDPQAKRIQVDAQSFSNEIRSYRLSDLLPGRSYHIKSRYRNSLGDWTAWSFTRFATLCPVQMPEAYMVGHNFIQLSWQRALCDDRGTAARSDAETYDESTKDVKQWEVRCTVGKAQTTMQLPVKECDTKLVNLLPGVDYTIDVRAMTFNGEWGLWSEPLVVTTLHRLSVRVDFSGETWLKVDWSRREKQYADNVTRYHVQVNCLSNNFRVAKYFPANVTNFTFENLKPGMPFHVVIQALSEERWGPWSEPTLAHTCLPCEPQLIRRGEDFVQLRWNCEYYANGAVDQLDRKFQIKIRRPSFEEELSEETVSPNSLFQEELASNTFRVNRMPPFSRVIAQVRAYDHLLQAWCDWGPEKEFRTLPKALVRTHVGETSVDVSWSRNPRVVSAVTDEDLEAGTEDPLAPTNVLKYVVRLNKVDSSGQHREVCKYHYDRSQPSMATIADLEADTQYSLQLSFLDNDVWSSTSAPLRFRTAPVMQITVLDVTEGACVLHWGRWANGKELPLTERTFKVVVSKLQGQEPPRQYSVQDDNRYTIRDLLPSTVYKIQVSGSLRVGSTWGFWSQPAYIFTTPAMQMELVQVGEDYAHLSWKRATPQDRLAEMLPNAKLCVVASTTADSAVKPQLNAHSDEGGYVYTGDPTVIEYHVQLNRVIPAPSDDPDAVPTRELSFESKLNNVQDYVRIPALQASTNYEALVCACTKSKQWGCWSEPLPFWTSIPTEVFVSNITQDHVEVQWGQRGSDGVSERDVFKYELRVQGFDDEYLREVELDATCRSYVIQGLSVNACYSVTLRRLLSTDKEWGQWSDPAFIFTKVVPVEVTEVSQDWVHLSWLNKPPPDNNTPKAQFLSLLSAEGATVVKLPASSQSHIFRDLDPTTLFTVHLLSIEQTPQYKKAIKTEQREKVSGRSLNAPDTVASFSLPIVSAEFASFLSDGAAFRTHSTLRVLVQSVGQNFAQLRWETNDATSEAATEIEDNSNRLYEVEVVETESEHEASRTLKVSSRSVIVRQLRPGCQLRFAVRAVAEKSEVPCRWSEPVVARLIPMIEPILGPGDGTDTPGVGEDYITVHWLEVRNADLLEKNSVEFDVRLTPLEGEDQSELVVQTVAPRYHFKNLRNDTRYRVEVRTRIAVDVTGGDVEVLRGEWSVPIVCATLSPMAVAVSEIVEVGATLHWRRGSCATQAQWWCDVDEKKLKEEIQTISSFHIRVSATNSGAVVFDEQIAEHQESFSKCRLMLKALSPGTSYTVLLRSSTGMMWGAWSEPVIFQTTSPCNVKLLTIGEQFVALEWGRDTLPQVDGTTVYAVVRHWEVAFSLIGTDSSKATRTVNVGFDDTRHCIGGLESNTPYHVTVRPVYESGTSGQWSEPKYLVTLPCFAVDVGKVGETFVQVSWERVQQETVQRRMKQRHIESMKLLATQLEELQAQLERKNNGEESEAPLGADALMDSESEQKDKPSDASSSADALQHKIDELQQKMNKRQKLSTLQTAELERSTAYPSGDDLKYELVVHGGAPEGSEQPFLFRRKLSKGELVCRLEGLQPKTIYEVTVRALFMNDVSMSGIVSTDIREVDETDGIPWGPWSQMTRFATLKPIVTKAKSVGSECIAVEWDTGGMGNEDRDASQRTAITKFQVHVVDVRRQNEKQRPVITLEDPSLKGYVVGGLVPNSLYTVTVRVCYEGDKWGVWSVPVAFMTMPKLLCRLQSVAERQLEFLIWRDAQLAPPEGTPNCVVWKPLVTEHQLAINGLPCSQPFSLEANTSTLLTLDTLNIDTEYSVSVKDRVEDYWQAYNVVLTCETIPYAPQRPTLQERKGVEVMIGWEHKQNLSGKQYLYQVEMAVQEDAHKKMMSNNALKRLALPPPSNNNNNSSKDSPVLHGNFEVLGYTTVNEFRLTLLYPVHHCYFRVKVCKTNQTMDGEAQLVTVTASQPQNITVDNPQQYVWSKPSTVAHFKTPSVPDHPTGLHVSNLTHHSALLRWNKPRNFQEHANILYRVYLNNSYQEKFTCIAETMHCYCELEDLITNCHYRVAVTAESAMGTSTQNNTLHFSTLVHPNQANQQKRSKPLSSTLPPRVALHAPEEIIEAVRVAQNKGYSADNGGNAFQSLLDDTASTVFTAARLTQRKVVPETDGERPQSNSAQRHRLLPPIHKDANASA